MTIQQPQKVQSSSTSASSEGLRTTDAPAPLPAGASKTPPLWSHQQQALQFIEGKTGAMLAMEMGTGKSAVAIHHADRMQCERILIVCPKSVATVWPKQFATHSARAWNVVTAADGANSKRIKTLQAALVTPPPTAVVVNYDVLTQALGAEILKHAGKFSLLILDECHKLKSAAGKQSRFASRLADRIPRRLGLTGTPMPHSPLDVYAQFRAIDKRIYGTSHAAFRRKYAVMGGYQNREVVSYENLDDLQKRFFWAAYRCKAADVLDLPPFIDVDRTCKLSPATRAVYKQMEDDLIAELDAGIITADNALVKLLRLAQITSGHCTTDDKELITLGAEKRTLFADVIDDIDAQEPLVAFARFRHDLQAIREVAEAAGRKCGELSGKHNDLEAWENQHIDTLAVQLQAGGVGIDLTRARYCVYYSHDFSLGNYDQTRARVHRPGQNRHVTYIHLLAENSVDMYIRQALERRADIVKTTLEGIRNAGK